MELFRRIGIAQELRKNAIPNNIEKASAYVTRFCGYELGRLPRPYMDWPTPELPNHISQIQLEKILRELCEGKQNTTINYGWRANEIKKTSEGYITQMVSSDGETCLVSSKYVIGADGASSLTRKTIGSRLIGEDGTTERAFMGGTMLSYYIKVPGLHEKSGRAPVNCTWIINPEMRGLMFSQDGADHWVAHFALPPGVKWEWMDPKAIIKDLLGCDSDFEIISGGPWTGGLAMVADRYEKDRIALVGDAAHLFTPLGGFGMNTGIGDVVNLCWKIAALEQGWGGPTLLDTYDEERKPIGIRNSRFGIECSTIMDSWQVPSNLEDKTSEAESIRKLFGAQLVREDAFQYHSSGLQLGERYRSRLIINNGETEPHDDWAVYQASDIPGGRIPHFWVSGGVSSHDLLGLGFSLLCFGKTDQVLQQEFKNAATKISLPLEVIELPLTLKPAVFTTTAYLIRPDQHIAWKKGHDKIEAMEILNQVRGM